MYVFEFTSEYVKRPVRNSDDDRELLKERKTAIIECDATKPLRDILSEYVKKHVRCVAEDPYI